MMMRLVESYLVLMDCPSLRVVIFARCEMLVLRWILMLKSYYRFFITQSMDSSWWRWVLTLPQSNGHTGQKVGMNRYSRIHVQCLQYNLSFKPSLEYSRPARKVRRLKYRLGWSCVTEMIPCVLWAIILSVTFGCTFTHHSVIVSRVRHISTSVDLSVYVWREGVRLRCGCSVT